MLRDRSPKQKDPGHGGPVQHAKHQQFRAGALMEGRWLDYGSAGAVGKPVQSLVRSSSLRKRLMCAVLVGHNPARDAVPGLVLLTASGCAEAAGRLHDRPQFGTVLYVRSTQDRADEQ